MRPIHITLIAAIAAAALCLAGCTRQSEQQTNANLNNAANSAAHAVQVAAASAGKSLHNDAVSLRVRTAMQTSSKLHGSNINVTTDHGVVTLSGTVLSADQKHVAGQIAVDTLGPDKKVVNSLQVSASQ